MKLTHNRLQSFLLGTIPIGLTRFSYTTELSAAWDANYSSIFVCRDRLQFMKAHDFCHVFIHSQQASEHFSHVVFFPRKVASISECLETRKDIAKSDWNALIAISGEKRSMICEKKWLYLDKRDIKPKWDALPNSFVMFLFVSIIVKLKLCLQRMSNNLFSLYEVLRIGRLISNFSPVVDLLQNLALATFLPLAGVMAVF